MSQEIKRREFLKVLLTSGIALTSAGSIIPILTSCEKEKGVSVEGVYDFIDHLNEAEIVAPAQEYVKPTSFTINGETKNVFFEHPDSQVTFKKVPIYKNARLTFGVGINEEAWKKGGDGVLFEIILTDEQSQKHPIYSRYLDPKNNPEERKWFDEEIDLKAFEGEKVSFTFKTLSGPRGNNAFDWAGWDEPKINYCKSINGGIKQPKHLNIILIVIDTLRADHLGCYGNKTIKTPFIDQIASEGVIFENHFSQCSITNPAHASIFTSLYLKNHGLYNNKTKLSNSVITLPEILKGFNYRTIAAVSAFHLDREYSGFGQGYDDYYDVPTPPGHNSNEFIFLTRRAETTNEKIFGWLENNFTKKFFMWIHYFDPHAPYSPPKPFNKMYYSEDPTDPSNRSMKKIVYPPHWSDPPEWLKNITDIEYVKAQYKGEVTYVDNEIGKLLNYLKELGLKENTLIILTSDHGESLGEHEMYFDHWGLHKAVLHVPLVLRCPQLIPSGKKVKSLTTSIDIVPTVLDLLNHNFKTATFDGESLISAIKDNKTIKKERYVYSENMDQVTVSVRSNAWAAIKDLLDAEYTSKYRFIKNRIQLYDVKNDPLEVKEVSKANPEMVKKFDRQLMAWLREGKAPSKPVIPPKVSKEVEEKLRALGYAK